LQNNLNHIALILDGNKRWSKKKKLNDLSGYSEGFKNIRKIINFLLTYKLKYLTIFALSSENFNRTSLNLIYEIIYKNFSNLLEDLVKVNEVKIKIIGSKEELPQKIIDIFNEVEKISKNNSKMQINIAFNYGFKEEIKKVIKKIIDYKKDFIFYNDEEIRNLFYLGNIPDPDILIRTGGYKRLSNFIMFNLTYTELFFSDTLWPDFTNHELEEIIINYKNINRKYGL
tara:strand:+ start:585 stop:1268 length:684 start_codon:yes stop_codon:yes gene_type:complete